MNGIIQFPIPKVETFVIHYDPITHFVDIPLIPDEPLGGACILAVFIDMLIEQGTLTANDAEQIVAQATGKL